MRFIFNLILTFLLLAACKETPASKESSPADSVNVAVVSDSTENAEETDCYDGFFASGESVKSPAAVTLLLSGNVEKTMSTFISEDLLENHVKSCFKDLDGDGKKELVIFNYTGGAHCCDEFYIFSEQQPARYQQRVKLMAGNTCIDPANNIFRYGFYEQLGYFFTCYACAYTDSTRGIVLPPDIEFKYDGGKMAIASDTALLNREVLRNLSLMKEAVVPPMKEDWDDTGFRKTFAIHLATWHYCNGRNLNRTKRLLEEYYALPDKANVWKEFRTAINDIEQNNSFNLK